VRIDCQPHPSQGASGIVGSRRAVGVHPHANPMGDFCCCAGRIDGSIAGWRFTSRFWAADPAAIVPTSRSEKPACIIDAGFSAKQIRERLASIGRVPEGFTGILVTHKHGDHIKGLGDPFTAGGCPGCDGDPRPVARRSGDRAHAGAKLPTPERGDDGRCAQQGGQAGEPDGDGGWRPWAFHRRSPDGAPVARRGTLSNDRCASSRDGSTPIGDPASSPKNTDW